MVCLLPKALIFEAALIWWRPLNYPMLTNIQKTHHLPWYYCSPPTNELTSRYLSLDEQWLELPRQFQKSSQINVVILAQKKFLRTNLPPFYHFGQLSTNYQPNMDRELTEIRSNLDRTLPNAERW